MPVPPKFGGVAPFGARAAETNSNPGIRRPRWGGVVEGVAVPATPSRTTGLIGWRGLTLPPKCLELV